MLTNTESRQPESPEVKPVITLPPSRAGRNAIAIRSPLANIAVALASLGLLAWSVGFFKTRASTVVSVDAVVNGTLVDLKSPGEGTLEAINTEAGKAVAAKTTLFQIRNARVSDLKVQELTSRLNQHKADLAKAQAGLGQQDQLAQLVTQDASHQTSLESAATSTAIEQVQADIKGAESRQRMAQDNYDRFSQLGAAGAIPMMQVDVARSELEQRESDVASLKAKITTLSVNQQATDRGLTLSRTRSNYDPAIRLQEIQLKTAQTVQEIKGLEQQITDTQAEIVQAKRDTQISQEGKVQAPIAGTIWSLNAQPGQYVQRGDSLGKLADCRQRWVDAIVDDSILSELQVGMPAKVQLRGATTAVLLNGKVTMIRSGLGRLNAGEDVVTPIERNLPRQTQVHIALENDPSTILTSSTPAVDNTANTAANLCYIGYTGRVSFDIKGTTNKAEQSVWQKFSTMMQRISS
jgi:multidrug resistance efflux pump